MMNRYPGVKPFEAGQQALFFGRDRDIADLCDLIKVEKLAVLFGKSGYGKSSILNAGVLPRLKHHLLPIEIRLGEYLPGHSLSPVETVRRKLSERAHISSSMAFLDQAPPTLWAQFKKCTDVPAGGFLLVFDQFEEFFSYPAEQQLQFKAQLAELLHEEMPEPVRNLARSLDRDQRRSLATPVLVRVVVAVRSDRLHELDRLKDYLPGILHKRYELRALSREQAREAIVGPALMTDPRPDLRAGRINQISFKDQFEFLCPPFEYMPDALEHILDDLSKSNTGRQGGIEAFQLQILCDSIESMVASGQIPDRNNNGLPDVGAADLPDFAKVYGEYYERRLQHLPEHQRDAARLLIEDGLVRYDPATGAKRRLSVDGDALLATYSALGLDETLLGQLEETYLLRREPNTLGGYNYELSHDTLLDPVITARKAREESKRMEQEATERERLKQVAEEQRMEEERLHRARRRSILMATGAFLLLVWALWQTWEANTAQKEADAEGVSIVNYMLKGANTQIKLLNYERADTILESAVELVKKRPNNSPMGQKRHDIATALLESAYCHSHAGKTKHADHLASLIGQLLDQPVSKYGDLENIDVLQNTFALLKQRYFPHLLRVPGGSFEMERFSIVDDIKEDISGELPDFHLAESETTWWQYWLFCVATGHKMPEKPGWGSEGDNPVVHVNWYDAVVYANWCSAQAGLNPVYSIDSVGKSEKNWSVISDFSKNGYRLPTETEWQYAAANAGKDTSIYAGSNRLDEVGWYWDNSSRRTHPVKTKKPNGLGLYDMSGNVWEWCQDLHAAPSVGQQTTLSGHESGQFGILRGGSWSRVKEYSQIARCDGDNLSYIGNAVGFRLARR